ncbi:ras family-domain-containing protein [Phycomyces blakesleeanus]|uniref:Uncharacterized protein n=2 Tax=Phycomyces blakesleeanus TaxID=4837 RepID=A0A162WMP7_PHYB8|nr:hypothetical protein PHYBLDRAFT_178161 [Phycomyces blakesleeanus NRRL 1555(-)]OAD69115.1 hypothetical protein PHYBLDRAFT_178161 [Phycomyces blakesleeanus NRRL 1555(-)]|eukprot:XP_018287155.1 hypothetical protein PHYBLDRAFT_178161 [Phycomyces blakesleeanus NRRL 1555(-)]
MSVPSLAQNPETNAPSDSSQSVGATPNAMNSKPVPVKLVLLGESAVGKSSLVIRFVDREFVQNREPTIGAAFLTQKCPLEDHTIKFEIWDTAGQERFHSLAPMYYRNAQAAIVVYDVTKAASLEKAKSWVKELQRQAHSQIVIALVGNKVDLVEATPARPTQSDEEAEEAEEEETVTRQVSTEEASAYAAETGLLFFETSARLGINVDRVFTEIAKSIPLEIIMYNRPGGRSGPGNTNQRINLQFESGNPTNKTSSGCAC